MIPSWICGLGCHDKLAVACFALFLFHFSSSCPGGAFQTNLANDNMIRLVFLFGMYDYMSVCLLYTLMSSPHR